MTEFIDDNNESEQAPMSDERRILNEVLEKAEAQSLDDLIAAAGSKKSWPPARLEAMKAYALEAEGKFWVLTDKGVGGTEAHYSKEGYEIAVVSGGKLYIFNFLGLCAELGVTDKTKLSDFIKQAGFQYLNKEVFGAKGSSNSIAVREFVRTLTEE